MAEYLSLMQALSWHLDPFSNVFKADVLSIAQAPWQSRPHASSSGVLSARNLAVTYKILWLQLSRVLNATCSAQQLPKAGSSCSDFGG